MFLDQTDFNEGENNAKYCTVSSQKKFQNEFLSIKFRMNMLKHSILDTHK